jgi:osmotically-inducible protein OsmY
MDVIRAAAAVALLLAGCTASRGDGNSTSTANRAATGALKDALLRTAVTATVIAGDPDATSTVGVTVSDGVVTLRGSVKDAKTRERLLAAARSTRGVKRVDDELRVRHERARNGAGRPGVAEK